MIADQIQKKKMIHLSVIIIWMNFVILKIFSFWGLNSEKVCGVVFDFEHVDVFILVMI